MKAIFCTKYGPPEVLEFRDIQKPIPKDNEILVKIYATTVTIGDVIIRSGRHPDSKFYSLMLHLVFGLLKPNPKRSILGMELAGKVESIGKDVTKFGIGDKVFASTFSLKFGGYAEYKCFPENSMIAAKPENLSYKEAAAVPGAGMTALNCLRKGKVTKGTKILINGASGAVGSNAVQLAKYFGAIVTGVCSAKNVELVKSLGADFVIDYTNEDFTQNSETYDVVFDAVAKVPASKAKKALNKSGKYLNVLIHSGSDENIETLKFLIKVIEEDKLKPIIDREYSFEQIIEAHEYVETGRKRGNVSIVVSENES
jgi:NADPH:quinone reductase-like Zn-dependent oxidoreductase